MTTLRSPRSCAALWTLGMAVALGASISFANPMGYTTNLLILGPGGYRFRDFLRVGLPLDILVGIVGVVFLPIFWPLEPL